MKITFVSLAIVVFAISCNSESVIMKTDLDLSNLNGKVWKVEKRIHDASVGCVCPSAQDECDQSLTIYDKKGNIAQSFDIDPNGDTAVHLKYLYNKNGICTRIEKFSKERLIGKEVPVFQRGKLIKLKVLDENAECVTTYNYKYSGNDVSQIEAKDAEGELLNKTVYENKDGKLVSQTETGKDGKVRSNARYIKNENNDNIEMLFSVAGDTSVYRVTYQYEYDAMGNWTKQTKYFKNEISSVVLRNITYYESSDAY
jgi:hypothetical protein